MRQSHCVFPVFLLAVSGACSPHVYVPAPPDGPPVYQEREPNDSPYQTDWIAAVDSISYLTVQGHVDDPSGWDRYDHFEFMASGAATFDIELEGFASYADLDLTLWDPDLEQVIAVWDSPFNPELASFTITQPGKSFVLVVESYLGSSAYDLVVMGRPATYSSEGDGSLPPLSPTETEHRAGGGHQVPDHPPAFHFEHGLPERFK